MNQSSIETLIFTKSMKMEITVQNFYTNFIIHIVIIPHSWLNVIRAMTVLKTGCLFRYFHYLMQGNNTRKQDFD